MKLELGNLSKEKIMLDVIKMDLPQLYAQKGRLITEMESRQQDLNQVNACIRELRGKELKVPAQPAPPTQPASTPAEG